MTDTEPEHIEREAELHRDRVASLVEELKARLSPGEIVDQVLGSMRKGVPQEFARNLGTQVRNNPLPCVLIGAGMAWLMLGGRNGRAHGAGSASRPVMHDMPTTEFASDARAHGDGLAHRASASVTDAAERAAEAARRARAVTTDKVESVGTAISGVAGAASQTYEHTRDAAARTYEQTRDTATQTYQQARGRMARTLQGVTEMMSNTFGRARQSLDRSADQVSDVASSASDAARQASSRVARLAHEQPLVLAGIGIAIGAALASLFPVTETENRLVGRTSDELKNRARDLATEGVEKVQSVATSAVETATAAVTEAAQQEANRQGLSFGGEHGTANREEPRERDAGSTEHKSGDASDGRGAESRDSADVRR